MRVLVVGGGPFQLGIIRAARALGAQTVVVDRRADAPGLADADYPHAIDTTDTRAVLEVARGHRVQAAVTAASDAAVHTVAAVVDALGLRGVTPAVARCCTDKLVSYEVVRGAGLPMPETHAVFSMAEAVAAATRLGGYPVVIKPRSGAGGRGVSIAHCEAEVAASLARARLYAHNGQSVLVQHFVGGVSVGVEAFFWRGELAAGFVLGDQFQEGVISPVGHSLPSRWDAATRQEILADVSHYASVLGITDGPANFDLRREGAMTVLLEANARLGGNSITDLVRTATGVDLNTATVAAACGEEPHGHLAGELLSATATRLILTQGVGKRVRYSNAALAFEHPALTTLDLYVSDGQTAALTADEWCILGRCIATGRTAGEAEDVVRGVAAQIVGGVSLEEPQP